MLHTLFDLVLAHHMLDVYKSVSFVITRADSIRSNLKCILRFVFASHIPLTSGDANTFLASLRHPDSHFCHRQAQFAKKLYDYESNPHPRNACKTHSYAV